ncbi:MAG: T9SS type A sorting domain-containing protein [Bacteroidota bacterium]
MFSALLNYSEKYVAEAAAHEAGHTLGLYHQSSYDGNCVKTSDYNGGQGTGEIAWAPIMGVGYYKNMTLWHNGANPYGCTSIQSDLAIITTNNGFGYRTDDYTNSINQAPSMNFTNSQFFMSGVVETTTDVDIIKFTLPMNSRFLLDAIHYNVGTGNAGSDVDLQVALYDSRKNLVRTYNPGTLLNSVIDTNLTSGNWYIQVEGKGNANAPDYASLGSYSLSGRYSSGGVLPLRQLVLKGQVSGDRHQFSWLIDADEAVTEQILEVSTDGRSFTPVSGTPTDSRAYQYKPFAQGMLQYRMKVSFDNGETHYSNLIALKSEAGNDQPKLISNLLTGNAISVSSPGTFDYAVYDLNGRILLRSQLSTGINNLPAGNLNSGMYMIRFNKGTAQWTEKLVRQ